MLQQAITQHGIRRNADRFQKLHINKSLLQKFDFIGKLKLM